MTTTQITGGSVRYTVPSNYSTGKDGCEATIHFTVAEFCDFDAASLVADTARNEAYRLATGVSRADAAAVIGGAPAVDRQQYVPAPSPAEAAVEVAAPAPTAEMVPVPLGAGKAPVVVPPTPAAAPAATITSAATTPAAASVGVVSEPAPGPFGPPSTPTSAPGPTAAPAVVGPAPPASTPSPSPESVVETITDENLRDAATHHSARIMAAAPKDPVSQETTMRKISALIAQFVAPPRTLYTIDQAQRRQFLDGLAAL